MKQTVLKIFKSRYFVIPVAVMFVVTASFFAYFSSISNLIIFPDAASYKYDYYTDKANDGNSEVTAFKVADSILELQFLLKDKFQSPYVGISITPLAVGFINVERFNQISLCLSGQNIDRVGLSIYTQVADTNENTNYSEALYHSYLNISNEKETYTIPVNQLKHPEWWEDLHHISENDETKPDLKHLLHFNIGSAFSTNIEKEKKLQIYSIAFIRNNHHLYFVLGLADIALLLLILGFNYWILFRKKQRGTINVNYQPIGYSAKTGIDEKCIMFINKNYNMNDLTLEIIAQETGISSRRITRIIHDTFNCNFKTYLNRIRINESQRFLTQTDLNMGEIAFKVGFNSQSHFNRVFKSEVQISPSEYRERNSS